jgi:hypothetical protein
VNMEDSNTGKKDSEALEISDIKLCTTKNNQGVGAVQRARDLKGKFVARTGAVTRADTKEAMDWLVSKDESGKSVAQRLREHLFEAAMKCEGRDVGAAVKTMLGFDEVSGMQASRKALLADDSHIVPVLKIVINSPILMNPEIIDGDNPTPAKTQPSFAATEPARAPYIDAEVVQQNRGPKKKPTGRKPYEEFSPEPVPASKPEPAHVPNALDILEARRADALKRGPQR